MDEKINILRYLKEDILTKDIDNYELHPEEAGNQKLNFNTSYIVSSIESIDNEIKKIATDVESFLSRNTQRLDAVMNIINFEKERLQDITMLCNLKTDYDNVIPLNKDNLTGNFGHKDNMFFCNTNTSSKINTLIKNITGNGYEGNKYVLFNNLYLEDSLPSNNREALIDNSENSFWEYSRITASISEKDLLSAFNTDSSEAKCTITFEFDDACNEITFNSDLNNVRVTNAKYSNDNVNYKDLSIMPFKLNDKEEGYTNQGYIYGNNLIAFPDAKFLKVTFESISYLEETLAFNKTVEINDNLVTVTTIIPSAKRHVIRLNSITAQKNIYNSSANIETDELINENSDDVYAISVFSNIYIPSNSESNSVKFVLTVNGEDIDVIPINNHGDGVKVVRFSQGKLDNRYTKYIGEKITSASLSIVIKSNGKISPYINNLKILLGGEV